MDAKGTESSLRREGQEDGEKWRGKHRAQKLPHIIRETECPSVISYRIVVNETM